ncbi:peptidase M50B-like-domain-containing protein [Naematelia encephala]|uniref:Peptidase M50B-like-domain-containing protein n=1 Tax=Naematelia encephala TaxID=71784 RepID=A0A1Y2BHW8_9TREE|nr:peptidase M50B-like-domain-containing protein [Naematelia encephala]
MEPRASVEWAKGHLTDAQVESIKAFVGSAIVTLVLWNGFPPIGTRDVWSWDEDKDGEIKTNDKGQPMGQWKKKIRWLPVLYPFKILTVFYHEISHAIVGRLTGGKPTFVMVDPYEGGLTEFALPPHKQPEPKSTLAAGYIGSCVFGCALIFAGCEFLSSIL